MQNTKLIRLKIFLFLKNKIYFCRIFSVSINIELIDINQIKMFNDKEYEQKKSNLFLLGNRWRNYFILALRHLIIYAVLMNRHQLAKILWKHSSEPIPLTLICCMMFKKWALYCHELYQRLLIEKQAKEFSDFAVGVLDKAFNEDNMRTFEILDEKHPVRWFSRMERKKSDLFRIGIIWQLLN